MDQIDTLLFDCDGVLWRGDAVIPGIVETLHRLRHDLKKRIFFVTNNSTLSRAKYVQKFTKLGIEATTEDIISSAYATALYLDQQWRDLPKQRRKAYVIGEEGITSELEALAIQWTGRSEADFAPLDQRDVLQIADTIDADVSAVVMGFDRFFCYRKMATAHYHLTQRDDHASVSFIATNADATYPAGDHLFPGTGAMVASVAKSTGRTPTVIGKPNDAMLQTVLTAYHLDPARTMMVGDRLDTDIAFGKRGGLKTLLVLTGVAKESDVAALHADAKPDHVLPTLNDIFSL